MFILILAYFSVHGCNGRQFAATTSIFDQKSHPTKVEGSLECSMNYSPNRMLSKNAATFNTKETDNFWKQNKGIGGPSSLVFSRSEDRNPSHHKALMQYSTKSEGSPWPRVNVRKLDLHAPFFGGEDLSETDYQPPHRKAPIHNK